MLRITLSILVLLSSFSSFARSTTDEQDKFAIIKAAKDYITSQHKSDKEQMDRALHPKLAKRTYWQAKDGSEFVMETSRETMLNVAQNYNRNGDKFPASPRIDIKVLDIDQRIASVKLSADDWIDYMHLIKDPQGKWQIINVLWQYHNINKHGTTR
jgi:hypothetical protein